MSTVILTYIVYQVTVLQSSDLCDVFRGKNFQVSSAQKVRIRSHHDLRLSESKYKSCNQEENENVDDSHSQLRRNEKKKNNHTCCMLQVP
ncbi:hypothetical protein BDR06DRAFT_103481 [Suillus hirtellus]|nr:hypothetical protein BDR06DRAFT_103481 [Suillus hirtellus]